VSYRQIKVDVYACHCERCGHDWQTLKLILPKRCAKCHILFWQYKVGVLKRGRKPGKGTK
jgi:hypothetical protein